MTVSMMENLPNANGRGHLELLCRARMSRGILQGPGMEIDNQKCHGHTIGDRVMRAGIPHRELKWGIPGVVDEPR
jgi:hypothetical protein